MTIDELDAEDADIPQMAVDALNAAHRRAVASGRAVVFIQDGELVEVSSSGKTVLKKVSRRVKVTTLVKRASK
jgi:hypothetical protein